MKKKNALIITVIALSIITVKTSYAYYEDSFKSIKTEKTINIKSVNSESTGFKTLKIQSEIPTKNDRNTGFDQNTNNFNGCGSVYGNMLDENGDFKDRDTFEQELKDNIQSGKISEEDKDYYLSIYDQCVKSFSDFNEKTKDETNEDSNEDTSDLNNNFGGFFPGGSCH